MNKTSALVLKEIKNSQNVIEQLAEDQGALDSISFAIDLIAETLKLGQKILLAGNGGSAADAQHIAGEFVSRLNFDRPGLPAIALTTDSSVLTAIGNDYGYEHIFSRQVQSLGSIGDVFIGLTTSGNSPNIIRGMMEAKARGLKVIGMTGLNNNLNKYCDLIIKVPSILTPKIQEGHIIIAHTICGLVESSIFSESHFA